MSPQDRTENGSTQSNWKSTRRHWLQAVGLAGVVGTAGCQGAPDSTQTPTETTATSQKFGDDRSETATQTDQVDELPEVGGTYTYPISSGVDTLNWIYSSGGAGAAVIRKALDPAFWFKPGQELFPMWLDLTTDDSRVWTAKLRENLQWSEPYGQMTAEDWVYGIKEVHQSDWAGSIASANWYRDGDPITVEKTGKYTFEIRLDSVDSVFPNKPTMWGEYMAPKELLKPYVDDQDVEGLKQDEELMNLSFTGNLGPYQFESWDRQSKIVLTRNEDYYMQEADGVNKAFRKAPYFDEYVFRVIPEQPSRLGALKTGEIDVTEIPPSQASTFQEREDINLNVSPQPHLTKVTYNMRGNGWEPFRKQGVRQALGCAIDKEGLVEGIYRGYAQPAYTWQPEYSKWYSDDSVVQYGTGDHYGPEVARERMREALSDTDYSYDGDNLVGPEGNKVTLSLYHSAGSPTNRSIAEYISRELQDNIGVDISVDAITTAQWTSSYAQQSVPEDIDPEWNKGGYNAGPRDVATSENSWDMSVVYTLNTYPMTPSSNKIFFSKSGSFNFYGYYPSFDPADIISEATSITDEQKRKELYAELFGKISEDQPFGMLAMSSDLNGYQSDINGPVEEFFNAWNEQIWYRE